MHCHNMGIISPRMNLDVARTQNANKQTQSTSRKNQYCSSRLFITNARRGLLALYFINTWIKSSHSLHPFTNVWMCPGGRIAGWCICALLTIGGEKCALWGVNNFRAKSDTSRAKREAPTKKIVTILFSGIYITLIFSPFWESHKYK